MTKDPNPTSVGLTIMRRGLGFISKYHLGPLIGLRLSEREKASQSLIMGVRVSREGLSPEAAGPPNPVVVEAEAYRNMEDIDVRVGLPKLKEKRQSPDA